MLPGAYIVSPCRASKIYLRRYPPFMEYDGQEVNGDNLVSMHFMKPPIAIIGAHYIG